DDLALARPERLDARREELLVLRPLELFLDDAERLHAVELRALLRGSGERLRGVRAARFQGLDYLFLLDACGLGQLRDRRRPLELRAHVLDQAREHLVQLLEPPRDVHRPGAVAEMPLDLADDRRHGVRPEEDPSLEVEPVDRLDQPDRRDLDEVVELLAAARVPARDRPRERQVHLDELVARALVSPLVIRAEQLVLLELVRTEAHARPSPATAAARQSRAPPPPVAAGGTVLPGPVLLTL